VQTEFSVAHTPQQDGVTEHINQTIFAVAEALIL
jgi:hypothetical protein